ncbi:hypothetical protein [Kamptonema formosum]|uniref:hypothetical protein n=1 Tax=Kamptonema formosum TaxID=331992 RepID=UPI00034853AB|nr:hypothetical protein [Oscillatoria sp. PCC 10802]
MSQRLRGRRRVRLGVPVERASKPVSDAVVAHGVRFEEKVKSQETGVLVVGKLKELSPPKEESRFLAPTLIITL